MSKTFFRHSFVVLVALLGVVVFCTSAMAGHSWGNYHWARTSNPFTLKLGDDVTSVWDPYLQEASSDWTASSVLNTTVVAGSTNPKNCKAVTGRVRCTPKVQLY